MASSHLHPHSGHGGPSKSMAASATLHCLTGCALGELAGLLVGVALGLGAVATILLAVGLAFLFGYSLSTLPLLKAGLPLGKALSVVLAADTLSILTMEIVDNAVMLLIPGAMHGGLSHPIFWLAMAVALAVAYWAAYPVNLALLKRGKGHALVHPYHGGEGVAAEGELPAWRRAIPTIPPGALAWALAAFLLGGFVASLG